MAVYQNRPDFDNKPDNIKRRVILKRHSNIEQYFHDQRTLYEILNFDVLPPLIFVFLHFKICMWLPRQVYKEKVLLSIVVLAAIKMDPKVDYL